MIKITYFLGEGNGNPLLYSCLENSMDRGAWQATVHGIPKSWTWLNDFHFHFSVENSMAISLKNEHWIVIWSSSSTSWCIKKVKVRTWTDVCIPMFLVTLFIVAKTRKQSKCPSTRWLDKQISITYNYSAFKRKRIWYMLQHCWTLKTLSSVK